MPPLDPRLPAPTTYPPTAILLTTPSGHQTHYLALLRPTSTRLSALLARSRLSRTKTLTSTHPEDVIERALSRSTFQHLSDGPRGGIWMLEAGNEEVVVCLVEEMEEMGRRRRGGGEGEGEGWRVLGIGVKGCEGRVYLLHPCEGAGAEEVGESGGVRGVAGANGGGRRTREVGREILGEALAGARAGARAGTWELRRMVTK